MKKAGITLAPGQPMDLYTMMKDYAGSDDPNKTEQGRGGEVLNIFPSRRVSVPVDINVVRQNGTVNANDSVESEIVFDIPKGILYKNDAAVLNMIAANKWKRPIYFTSPDAGGLGLQDYMRQDGLTYRLVPVRGSEVNADWVYDKMMNKFSFGNANLPGVYFDEENRRHLISIRLAYAQAAGNLADAGRKEDAKKMLYKVDTMMLEENFPYGMASRRQQHNQTSLQMLIAAYKCGDTVLANKITKSVQTDLTQQMEYYNSLDEDKQAGLEIERYYVQNMLKAIPQIKQSFGTPPPVIPTDAGGVIKTQPTAPVKGPDTPKKR
jgi:hypothetical protein